MLRRLFQRPEVLPVAAFAALILIGTLALLLPICHAARPVSLLDALFTATSAVCVTGLITVNTAEAYSGAGQTVILILIQLGGLGVMTFAALAYQLFHQRVSFGSQAALQDVFFQGQTRVDLRAALRRIVLMTLAIELIGAILIHSGLPDGAANSARWFDAVFLSISAFCNAGFSVYADSAMGLRDSALLMYTLMALIVAGGLGYMVLFEAARRFRGRLRGKRPNPVRWSLNSRVVLITSVVLIVGGTAALLLTGLPPETGRSLPAQLQDALFQSVTARTAGFNTVDITLLPLPSLMILMPLMFVGGSPGSCAGGIKTTSLTVWLTRVMARITGREDVNLGGRRIPHDVVRKAALVIALAAMWNSAGVMILAVTEEVGPSVRFEQLIFEQVSAFATVGLSAGITERLSVLGKLWIAASMLVGRLGPLTIALLVVSGQPRARIAYPTERIMIG